MTLKEVMDNRLISGFNMSIGTGIALETLFMPLIEVYDEKRVVDKVDISKYKYHYFNIYVLVRNIITSLPTIQRDKLMYSNERIKIITRILDMEIEVLDELYSNVKTEAILWLPDYSMLYKNVDKKEYIGNISKKDEIFLLVSDVIEYIRKEIKNKTVPLRTISTMHLLPKCIEPVLLTTYFAVDLLNIKKSSKLDLLETHTGKLITKEKFNKKIHPIGKLDLSRLPFTEFLLYLLGDNTLIPIEKLGTRRDIYKLAQEKRWNPVTSESQVKHDLLRLDVTKERVKKFRELY